jgi:hypothetical protein
VATVGQRDEPRRWHGSDDVLGDLARDEVVVAVDDERRHSQRLQLRHQVVGRHLPRVSHQPVFHGPGLQDAFAALAHERGLHPRHQALVVLISRQCRPEVNPVTGRHRFRVAGFVFGARLDRALPIHLRSELREIERAQQRSVARGRRRGVHQDQS